MILPFLLLGVLAPGFEQLAGTVQGRVGAMALVAGQPVSAGMELYAAERFPMQSVYKLPIRGMVRLLLTLQEERGLSAASRTLLLRMMTETGTGPARLKGRLPAGASVAHKTGTSGTIEGMTAATNDVGLITLPDGRTLASAVFVSDCVGSTEAREGVIAKLSRIAWDAFSIR